MKRTELKQHIGHRVRWEYAHDCVRGTYLQGEGLVQEVKGNNILIDGDYYWLPDLHNLTLVETPR